MYAATKWAVVGFTQSLAKELGPDGIRVNAILPGVVDGERFESVVAARAAALGRTFEEVEQEYLSHVSLRRKVSTRTSPTWSCFSARRRAARLRAVARRMRQRRGDVMVDRKTILVTGATTASGWPPHGRWPSAAAR